MKKITFQMFCFTMFFVSGTLSVKAQFAGGIGSLSDPYQIATAVQLNEVRNNLTANYKLINDIDLSGWLTINSPTTGWTPIGTVESPFSGSFDGNGHVISGLWINLPVTNFVGLFSYLYNPSAVIEIKNIGVHISSQGIVGQSSVGGIVGGTGYSGTTYSNVTLQSVFVQGNVSGTDHVGAIVGRSQGNITLTNAYAGGGGVTGKSRVGGLIGSVERSTTTNITKCYTLNTVVTSTVSTPGNVLAAGIIASAGASSTDAAPAYITISSCVAINPSITGLENTSAVGRIIAWHRGSSVITFENYAYEEMLVNGTTGTTSSISSKNGLNKTADDLKALSTFVDLGWDFANKWQLGNGTYQYPVLKNILLNKQPGGSGLTTSSVVEANKPNVFYNKASGNVVLVGLAQEKPVYVYNTYGHLIVKSQDSSINLSSFSKGVYIIKVDNYSLKIVK